MDKSMGIPLTILVAIFVSFVSSQSAQGRYDHSKRIIDFRYPDYIVDPRPPCLAEGFFQHPRNCSWFYRCHDIRKMGFYRQFYFECAPGTIFAESLDICVAGDHSSASCGDSLDSGGTTVIFVTTDAPVVTSGTGNGTSTDSSGGSSPETDSTGDDGGSPITSTGTPDGNGCYDFMIICKEYICPTDDGGTVSIGAVCERAYKECENGVRTHFCEISQYYNMETEQCINNPVEDGCAEIPDPFATTTTTTTTTTTKAPVLSKETCYDSMKGCSHYFCPDGQSGIRDEYLCKSATRTCDENNITHFCLDTQYYNFDTQKCVEAPEDRHCRPKEEPSSQTLNISFFVECSALDSTPRNEKFEEYFCQNYNTCNPFRQSKIMLCRNYLQCILTDDEWSVEVMECPPGLLYSYSRDQCVITPAEVCQN